MQIHFIGRIHYSKMYLLAYLRKVRVLNTTNLLSAVLAQPSNFPFLDVSSGLLRDRSADAVSFYQEIIN